MHTQFYRDLMVPNSLIQVSLKNKVLATFTQNIDTLKQFLDEHQDDDIYFLTGVRQETQMSRAKDTDILMKSYIYFDFDLRKEHPEMTDDDIKSYAETLKDILATDKTLSQWRYIVFTGNGLHVYYVGEPVEIRDRTAWKMGMTRMIEKMEKMTDEKLDDACTNPARLGRAPGTRNQKNSRKNVVEIVGYQDIKSDIISRMEGIGRTHLELVKAEAQKKQASMIIGNTEEQDTYRAINEIPIGNLVASLMGWDFDGKNFFEPTNRHKSKACFIPPNTNYIIHGGTDHFPSEMAGFCPFAFVKTYHQYSNAQTFDWFKRKFPHIELLSRKERDSQRTTALVSQVKNGKMDEVFKELKDTRFEQLYLTPSYDAMKFIIRGAVTRIGAYSNIGKSKFAYYLSHLLLTNGYKGMIFSTEVTRPLVLANLLTIQTGIGFWDIIDKKKPLPEGVEKLYNNLEIYDVSQTHNSLEVYEAILEKSENKPDFIVIDFVQSVIPKQKTNGEYEMMSKYALEIQSLAQRYNVAVIDLSQISNEGVRDEYRNVGMIPFKGSGHLYSSADIGILLKRDKKIDPNDMSMDFQIRKHKYLPPGNLTLDCDFKNGTFKVFGHQFEEEAPTLAGAISQLDLGGGEY